MVLPLPGPRARTEELGSSLGDIPGRTSEVPRAPYVVPPGLALSRDDQVVGRELWPGLRADRGLGPAIDSLPPTKASLNPVWIES
jgi:hypothetical protein